MENPLRSIDRQLPLWESATIESPPILTREQQKELLDMLAELLVSSISAPTTGATRKGADDDAG